MTISIQNNDPRISYSVASGVTQTSFTIPFDFYSDSDVNVYVDDVLKVITADYTVSGGSGSTGTLTMSVTGASGTGSTVVILRNIPLDRTTDFPLSGPFNISSLNTELDRFVAITADQRDGQNQSITVPDAESYNMVLPKAADRAGKLVIFDEVGNVEVASEAAIGNIIVGANFITDAFTGDGSTVAFTLSVEANSKNNTQVHVDGVYQNKTGYSLNAAVLTFSEAPPLNAAIEVVSGDSISEGSTANSSAVDYNQGGTGAVDRTVKAKLQETVSVKDFGAVGDGATDDTAAIQAAINYAATAKLGVVYLPAGHYSITRIYLNYDASNNTGYPSDSYYQGRIALQGDGRATKQNQSNSARTGTLIEGTLTTGNVIVCDGTSSGTTAQQVQIKDLSVYASTSGSVFRFISVVQNSGFENVYIRQGGSGEGINWQDCWVSFIRNVRIDGAGKTTSNDGIYLRNVTSAGGFVDMVSVIVNAFHTSIRIGHETYGSGARLHSVNMQNCQGGEAEYGLEIAHGADQVNLLGCHFEDNDTGLFIVNGASNVSIDGSSFSTNTISAQCGNDTTNGDKYQGVSFFNNKFFSNSGTTEHIKLFSSGDTGDVLIEQCSFTGDSGATDTAIWLEDEDHHHVRLLAPEFISNLSTEIANASRIQEYHDEKSVYWRTVNTGGSLSSVPFRFRSDTSSGGLAPVEFSQNDNNKAFIRLDTDITPSNNSNHISTTNAAGSVTGPSDGSWTFSRMALIETNDATGVGEYWMPLFTKN